MSGKDARIHVGTSGWSYGHWKGPFYPRDLPGSRMLEFYAQHFHSVEINSSFYRLPEHRTLQHWHDVTPAGFRFSAKASRYITHLKKLREPRKTVAAFLERIGLLDDKLGPILFQLPPHWHCNPERLARFLDGLDDGFRYAFEFRDPSWLNRQIFELLARHRASFCIYELEGFATPLEITAPHIYVRLHGPAEAYRGSYSRKSLSAWARTLAEWAQQGFTVYCYFDNDEAGYAALNAGQLQELLAQQ